MRDQIERALGALVGLSLAAAERAVDTLWLHFGEPRPRAGSNGDAHDEGGLSLQVACPWRLADRERVLVGSGDLFTPADPDEEPETFDWEPAGASWLDVRLQELSEGEGLAGRTAERVEADALGGARIVLSGALTLELFPNSTPTGHVATEFWRLVRRDGSAADFVVGTFGIEHEPRA